MRRILTLVCLLACLAACSLPALAQAPIVVAARSNGSGQITVAWTAVTGATGYNIYYGTTNGGPYPTLANSAPVTATSYTVAGLNDGTSYHFVVHAIVGGNESADSPSAGARSGSVQNAAPTGVTATASSGKVVLTWNSVPSSYYYVYRQPISPTNDTYLFAGQITSGTTYTDTNVTNGTSYNYAVATVNGNGEGNTSGWVAATPLATPVLTAEATANQSGTEIDLSWTAVTGATSYNLYYGTISGGESSYVSVNGTTYADTGLPTNTTYYFYIVAVANGGTSAPSGEVSAKTGSAPLAAPTLTGTATDGQVQLTWSSVSGAASYDLYRTPNPTGDTSGFYTRVLGMTYTDTSVTDGTAYTYQVAADAGTGQGTLSNSLTLTPLASPTMTATPTSASTVSLTWMTITGATGYTVERATAQSGPWTQISLQSGTSLTDTGLTSAADYYYRGHATASGSDSGPGNAALAETYPNAPVNLVASAGNGKVILTWQAPSGAVGGYTIYRGTSSGQEQPTSITHGVTGLTYTDPNVTNGTTYYYKITATDLGGESVRSNEASATPTTFPPAAPTLSINSANGLVSLSWTVSSGAASYNLYRSTTAGGEGSTPVQSGISGTTWTDTGRPPGTTYYYKVTGVNGVGESPRSNEASIVVSSNSGPTCPAVAFVIAGDSHVALYWQTVSGAATYNLYRSVGGGAFSLFQHGITATTIDFLGNSTTDAAAYDNSVTNGTPVLYYITSVNSANAEGVATSPIPVTPVQATSPVAPLYPAADYTTGTGAFAVNFNPSVSPGVYYDVYRANVSGMETAASPIDVLLSYSGPPSRISAPDSGFTNGTTYYYTVRTVAGTTSISGTNITIHEYVEGPASAEVSFISGSAALGAPVIQTAALNGNFAASFTWGLVPNATSYNVYLMGNQPTFSGGTLGMVNTTGTSYTIPAPYGGTFNALQARVAAVNSVGEGALSAAANATLTGFGLQPVTNIVTIARGQHGSVTINDPSANNITGLVSLSVSGAPTGVTAWLDPVGPDIVLSDGLGDGTGNHTYPENHSEGSTLFLNVGSSVSPGTYLLTVTGVSGATTQSVIVSLIVT